jgi:hypothetical protein
MNDPTSKPKCGECRYWKPHAARDDWPDGHCRRSPPSMIVTDAGEVVEESRWPSTERNDWCGEWKPESWGDYLRSARK